MKKGIILWILITTTPISTGAELVHQFNSPSFSGSGYSSHALTIYQLEEQRKQKLKDEATSAQARADAAAKNTNLQKFLNNLESRIYAQLSKQMADAMFGESGANSGSMDFQGTNINWVKTGTDVTLTIIQPDGGRTEVTVPIASFSF